MFSFISQNKKKSDTNLKIFILFQIADADDTIDSSIEAAAKSSKLFITSFTNSLLMMKNFHNSFQLAANDLWI